MDPLTLSLILGGAQAATGAYQNIKGRQLAKQNKRPDYEVQPGYWAGLDSAQRLASQTQLPGQSMAEQQLLASQSGAINKIGEVANSPAGALGAIAQTVGNTQQSQLDLAQKAAANYAQNQQNLQGQQNLIGQEQQNAWNWNQMEKFKEQAATASELQGSGMQNLYGSLSGIGTAAIMDQQNKQMLEAQRNSEQLMRDMYGLNSANTNTGATTGFDANGRMLPITDLPNRNAGVNVSAINNTQTATLPTRPSGVNLAAINANNQQALPNLNSLNTMSYGNANQNALNESLFGAGNQSYMQNNQTSVIPPSNITQGMGNNRISPATAQSLNPINPNQTAWMQQGWNNQTFSNALNNPQANRQTTIAPPTNVTQGISNYLQNAGFQQGMQNVQRNVNASAMQRQTPNSIQQRFPTPQDYQNFTTMLNLQSGVPNKETVYKSFAEQLKGTR